MYVSLPKFILSGLLTVVFCSDPHSRYNPSYMLSPLQTQGLSSFSENSPENDTRTPMSAEADFFSPSHDASSSSGSYASDTSSPLSPTVTMDQLNSGSTASGERQPSSSSPDRCRGRNRHIAPSPYRRSEHKKRNSRRIWTHALEKYVFTPHEMYVVRFSNLVRLCTLLFRSSI